MEDNEKIQDQALPEEDELYEIDDLDEVKQASALPVEVDVKEKKRLSVRIKNAVLGDNDPSKDVIFSQPLSEETVDETAPLKKGNIDGWFLLWTVILLCFGAVMSYSASAVFAQQRYDDSAYFLWRYIIFAVIAIVITAVFIIFARPWMWRIVGVLSYAAAVVLLIVVIFAGDTGGGAQRWIDLGFVTIQPSEIAKMAVVMVLALYMSKYDKEINSVHKFGGNFKHGFIMPMVLIGILCALIILQPHLSGTMIVGLLGVAVMFMGGTRMRWLAIFLGIIFVVGVVFIAFFGYSMERVEIWLHIDEVDPLGEAWQTLQGLYAIGSGGFFGLGLGSSRQKFGYVSQPQNDFIFTIICEELGFVGAFCVVFLFGLLIWRGIKIGQNAPDKFCSLVVWGLTMKIAIQVLMNIAVVTNSMPNTGISLPFFSSGGSSLMLQIFEMGIILSISRFSTQKK